MKIAEKLRRIKEKDCNLFMKTRQQVFDELNNKQTMFCVCGKLATGLHTTHCKKFNDKVTTETVKRLSFLIEQQNQSESLKSTNN